MGLTEFILWWVSAGIGLSLMYLFIYHHGPESWVEYEVYLEKNQDEEDTETNFEDIQRMGSENFMALFFIGLCAIIPIIPLLFLLHDSVIYPDEK